MVGIMIVIMVIAVFLMVVIVAIRFVVIVVIRVKNKSDLKKKASVGWQWRPADVLRALLPAYPSGRPGGSGNP